MEWKSKKIATADMRLVAPLAFLFLLTGCTSVPNTPEAQFNAGRDALRDGNLEKGKKHLRKTLELAPDHLKARHQLASYHMIRNNPQKAIDEINTLIDISRNTEGSSPSPKLYVARGFAHYQGQNYYKAIRDYSRVLQAKPESTDARNSRGLAFVSIGQYESAKNDFKKSLKVKETAQAYLGLTMIHLHHGQLEQAHHELGHGIKANPELPITYWYRALVHQRMDRSAEMEKDLEKYMALVNPDASRVQIRRAVDKAIDKWDDKYNGKEQN